MGYIWITYVLHMGYTSIRVIYMIYIWFIYGLYMARMGYSSVTY
jgi:hypothetical protein